MRKSRCLACGKVFLWTPNPNGGKAPIVCSPECRKTREKQLRRIAYANELERQGKQRSRGGIYFGKLRCTVDGCDGKYYAKGMCNKHYARAWRRVNPASSVNASRRYRRAVHLSNIRPHG